jgi:AcrR family transcriptional regulator
VNSRSSEIHGRDGRSERWRAHREARRQELLATVMTVVSAEGEGVGIDDIARASHIAKPIFYRYFRDKAELFVEVGRAVAETVVAETTAAIDGAQSPRSKLAAGIDAYLASIESRPELYRFVLRYRDLDDYATIVGRHATTVIGEFMREAGQDSGAAELWGFGIVGLVRSAADRWLEERTMSRAAVVEYLMNLIWPGLAGMPAGQSHASDAVQR